ncbi:33881_t:CDS:2, partial [Gigaspora margarita]
KMKYLQKKGLGEKNGLVALTVQQVREILNDEFLDPKTLQSLLYRVFFYIATIFAYRDSGNAQCIQLLADQSDTSGPTSDLTKYISKYPSDASNNFYLVEKFMKDIGQKVKVKLPDKDAIMDVIGHKSSQDVCAYKTVSESQKINMMKTLINTIKPASNINPINQESSALFTEITRSYINFNTILLLYKI